MKSNRFCGAVLFPTILLLLSCRSEPKSSEDQFQILFEGFRLVLVGDLPTGRSAEELDISGLHSNHPLERRLDAGRVYIFTKVNDTPDDVLALKVFPGRITKIGGVVTNGPRSSQDLMYLITGGPLFKIEFRLDSHRGVLFNRVFGAGKERLVLLYE